MYICTALNSLKKKYCFIFFKQLLKLFYLIFIIPDAIYRIFPLKNHLLPSYRSNRHPVSHHLNQRMFISLNAQQLFIPLSVTAHLSRLYLTVKVQNNVQNRNQYCMYNYYSIGVSVFNCFISLDPIPIPSNDKANPITVPPLAHQQTVSCAQRLSVY